MDFRKALPTTFDLPVQSEAQEKILNIAASIPLSLAERDEFLSICGHFPADIFIINAHYFTILCNTPEEWVLVPLTQHANEQYRRQHLISASHLHHCSVTIH